MLNVLGDTGPPCPLPTAAELSGEDVMSITQQTARKALPPDLDELIAYMEKSITKQVATIQSLTSDGHEVTDAAKYLNQMIGNLAALMQKKKNAG